MDPLNIERGRRLDVLGGKIRQSAPGTSVKGPKVVSGRHWGE